MFIDTKLSCLYINPCLYHEKSVFKSVFCYCSNLSKVSFLTIHQYDIKFTKVWHTWQVNFLKHSADSLSSSFKKYIQKFLEQKEEVKMTEHNRKITLFLTRHIINVNDFSLREI